MTVDVGTGAFILPVGGRFSRRDGGPFMYLRASCNLRATVPMEITEAEAVFKGHFPFISLSSAGSITTFSMLSWSGCW